MFNLNATEQQHKFYAKGCIFLSTTANAIYMNMASTTATTITATAAAAAAATNLTTTAATTTIVINICRQAMRAISNSSNCCLVSKKYAKNEIFAKG